MKKVWRAVFSLLQIQILLFVPFPVDAADVQFVQDFHIRSSFDCWRNEKGEWTLELGGQGAQVLGVPGEYVDYIIPYPLPPAFQEAELTIKNASWESLTPEDPYYAESIPTGEVLDVFLSEDQELCVRVRARLQSIVAPEDITQSWQDPPILGLRYIVPLVVEVRGASALPTAHGDILFSPNSSDEAEGAVRGWYNRPLMVQVSYQGEEPFANYQENNFEYVWSERTYVRTMLNMGYSPWQLSDEQTFSEQRRRKSKFWLSPDKLLVESPEQTFLMREGRKILLDKETAGYRLTGQIHDYDSLFAGYLLSQADVRGSLNDTYYIVPDYGFYRAQEQPKPQFPEIFATSGMYRLDFTPPEIKIMPQNKEWYNQKLDIGLEIAPGLSGLYQTHCQIKDLSLFGAASQEEIWFGDGYPQKISLDQEGAYQINIHSEDVAGNTREEEYGLYLLDFTAPYASELNISGIELAHAPCNLSYTENMELRFKANDNLSGLRTVEYAISTEKEATVRQWRQLSFLEHDDLMRKHELYFEVPLDEVDLGECYLFIHLVDKAGNDTYQEFGPIRIEGIGDFKVLYLSDPRWEGLFLDKEKLPGEILWRGLKLEDFWNLNMEDVIRQDMFPFYQTEAKQGFHPGYVLIAEFKFCHFDFDKLCIEDRFYRNTESDYEPLDLIVTGAEYRVATEDTKDRIHWIDYSKGNTHTVLLRYSIPANAMFSPLIQEELTVDRVKEIRDRKPIREVLVSLDIWLESDGKKLSQWKTEFNKTAVSSFWYGCCKKTNNVPSGALCWLDLNGSSYGDLEKRFP